MTVGEGDSRIIVEWTVLPLVKHVPMRRSLPLLKLKFLIYNLGIISILLGSSCYKAQLKLCVSQNALMSSYFANVASRRSLRWKLTQNGKNTISLETYCVDFKVIHWFTCEALCQGLEIVPRTRQALSSVRPNGRSEGGRHRLNRWCYEKVCPRFGGYMEVSLGESEKASWRNI